MTATRIQFLAGLDTIGGNIILIEHGDYRVITDFGAQVGAQAKDLLDLSKTVELIEAGLLPKVDGIYPQEQVQGSQIQSYQSRQKETIICLSHLHIDHLGSLKHVSSELPVYASAEAMPLYQQLVDHGFLPDYQLELRPVEAEVPLEFGPFKIRYRQSDHDTLGASAIFIECPDGQLIHSGDLRLTGFHPERVWIWALEARQKQVDLLLLEGTSFSEFADRQTPVALALAELMTPLQAPSELGLLQNIKNLLTQQPDQLFTFNGYPQNVERFIQLVELCQQCGRQVLVQEAFYHFIQPFLPAHLTVKSFNQAGLVDIHSDPGSYLIQVDQDFLEIIDQLPRGSYLHSNGEPLGLFMPGYEAFVRGIVERGWKFYQADVSGHAEQRDLLNLAYLIQAKGVLPWHSFNPLEFGQALNQQGLATCLPVKHQWYTIEEIKSMIDLQKEGMA